MIEQKSKIGVVVLLVCLVFFILGGVYFIFSNEKESQVAPTFRNHQTNTMSEQRKETAQTHEGVEKSQVDKLDEENKPTLSTEQTARAFAEKYINYQSIDERNQSLLPLVTEKYAKENSLKETIPTTLTSSGQVIAVFQDKENAQKWLVEVEQAQEGTNLMYMIALEINEVGKISQMRYHLYKLAY
ncbi:hypothetical protein RyT2_21560 [Pseudolactococcus yaeyamensis]